MALVPIHGRDHCPGGPDPIPCLSSSYPYIYRINETGQTIEAESPEQVVFSTGTTQNEGTDYFAVSGVDPDVVIVTGPGRFSLKAQVKWVDAFAGGTIFYFNGAGGWYHGISFELPGGAVGNTGLAPVLYYEVRLPSGVSNVELQIEQWSTGDQGLESATMEIARLGDYTGSADLY